MKRFTINVLIAAASGLLAVGVTAQDRGAETPNVNDWDTPWGLADGQGEETIQDWDTPFGLRAEPRPQGCPASSAAVGGPFAKVSGGGFVWLAPGFESIERLGVGVYRVILGGHDSNTCAYSAQSPDVPTASISVQPVFPPGTEPPGPLPSVFERTAYVMIWAPGGDPVDASFDLIARCLPTGGEEE